MSPKQSCTHCKNKFITHIYDLLICDNSVDPADMDNFFLQI